MAERKLGTYQMLWDCPFCGTTRLLGVDYRHCPSCGAAQDPSKRYFPSEADKVAVEDHKYSGADKTCANCNTPNGALASHCVNCGSSLDDAKEVVKAATRASAAEASASIEAQQKAEKKAQSAPPPQAPPKKSGWLAKGCLVGCGLLAMVLAVLAVVALVWKKDASLVVTGHRWERSVDIEEFSPTQGSAWCDSVPSGANVTGRHSEVRSHNPVPDGETCHNEQHDNGDGTFSEVQKCTPKTKDEPVYADKCTYTVNQWHTARTVKTSGASLREAPAWPAVNLTQPGNCVGCQREGPHHETYTVLFKGGNKDYDCAVPQQKWQSLAEGSHWNAKVGVVSGDVDCDTLTSAR